MMTAVSRNAYIMANTGFVMLNRRLRDAPAPSEAFLERGRRSPLKHQAGPLRGEPAENILAIASRGKGA
jgi:hypothetical protein